MAIALATSSAGGQELAALSPDEMEFVVWAQAIWDSLTPIQEDVNLLDGLATLSLNEEFYFLDEVDSEKVLTEVWGNPAGSGILGMVFPRRYTPFDPDAWAVTIDYAPEGHVDDLGCRGHGSCANLGAAEGGNGNLERRPTRRWL